MVARRLFYLSFRAWRDRIERMDEIRVIYEYPEFLAVYKPAGVLVHTPHLKNTQLRRAAHDGSTLVDWVLARYPEVANVGDDPVTRPGIVHRLDRETSGVLIVARTQEFFEYLKKQFQAHKVTKTYAALVYGRVAARTGVIDAPISLKTGSLKRTVRGGAMTKEAVTEYRVEDYFILRHAQDGRGDDDTPEHFTLLSVYPKTGRTHQIRVHLASIRHPIVGDALYTKRKDPFQLGRQFLHAESLEFVLPSGEKMKIEVGLPDNLNGVLSGLQRGSS